MPTTPGYGLPYPDSSDLVIDGPAALQDLALAVDDELAEANLRQLGQTSTTTDSGFMSSGAYVDDLAVAFTAPASGTVDLDARVLTFINGGNFENAGRISYRISGPTTVAADDSRSVLFAVLNNGTPYFPTVTWRFQVTGLTAGGSYTAYLALKGTGGWYGRARQLNVDAA